ncbi:CheR family methyltransferase [Kineococcus rhizosphaerae]|uniref:protein-glutamate O-methyltransferase n=1 Tax=Kineococcus rhizosphaerae TaxID=559628 RepID=A0A2T0R3A4_9ACTN|nr:CheR family methyltransferase [Kineococcus rhizosphaerae]PRY14539.1 two-component system CheB/CheR fusion protein [Kineococcus rhizosphaerae]
MTEHGDETEPVRGTTDQFEGLLEHLKEARGFDFTGYKRASLLRRVHRRMDDVGVSGYEEYRDRLEVDADEFTALFNTILINVTSFFRDTDAWDKLRTDLLPQLLSQRPSGPIRAWSAGCASGQEAYTIAICLAEILGPDEFRDRVKIYATDADDEALTHARTATYTEREVKSLPPELLERYFEPNGSRYTFRQDLRRSVIFGRADLVQDAPISHVDLLTCRNTLMYLTAETQARIAERLHYSLKPEGLLFLGKAEMLLSQSALFSPVDLKNRFFRRVGGSRTPHRITATVAPAVYPPVSDDSATLRAEALAASPVAQIVLNAQGEVVLSNHRADTLFGLTPADTGRPFQDLEVSYRPVELRSAVEQAHTQRRTVWIRDVEFTRPRSDRQWFDVQVVPLRNPQGHALGTAVVFIDVSRSRQLQDELEDAHRQLETAYEELQSTNEELETTNEELQSTVEELETTNEELHSTNEELETMNEELQSMNDELQNSNHELRLRTDEVSALNAYMEGVFASLRVGVAVVDADMRVTVWNAWAADLWGVRADEAAGQHLLNLDIGLPLIEVGPAVRTVLAGEELPAEDGTFLLEAVNRRGRSIRVQVTVSSLAGASGRSGAIVVMDQLDDA